MSQLSSGVLQYGMGTLQHLALLGELAAWPEWQLRVYLAFCRLKASDSHDRKAFLLVAGARFMFAADRKRPLPPEAGGRSPLSARNTAHVARWCVEGCWQQQQVLADRNSSAQCMSRDRQVLSDPKA